MPNVGALYMTAGLRTEQLDRDLAKTEQKLTWWQKKQQTIQSRMSGESGIAGMVGGLRMAAAAAGILYAEAAARRLGDAFDKAMTIIVEKGGTARDVIAALGSEMGKALPIVGGFFSLGESIGKWAWGEGQAEAFLKKAEQAAKIVDVAVGRRNQLRGERDVDVLTREGRFVEAAQLEAETKAQKELFEIDRKRAELKALGEEHYEAGKGALDLQAAAVKADVAADKTNIYNDAVRKQTEAGHELIKNQWDIVRTLVSTRREMELGGDELLQYQFGMKGLEGAALDAAVAEQKRIDAMKSAQAAEHDLLREFVADENAAGAKRAEVKEKRAQLEESLADRYKSEVMGRAAEGARLEEEALPEPEKMRKRLEEMAAMVEQGSLSTGAYEKLARGMVPEEEKRGGGAFGLIQSARMSLSGMAMGGDTGEAAKKTAENTRQMKVILEQMLGKLGIAA